MALDHLYVILELYPEKIYENNIEFTRYCVAHNRLDLIKKFPLFHWAWRKISLTAPMELIDYFNYNDWDWNIIHRNPNFKIELVEKYPKKKWNWTELMSHPQFTLNLVEKFPGKKWDQLKIIEHPDFNLNLILKLYKVERLWRWSVFFNSNYYKIEKFIEFIPILHEDIINGEFIFYYSPNPVNHILDWSDITQHSLITAELIEKYPQLPWNWKYVHLNPNFTLEMLKKIFTRRVKGLFELLQWDVIIFKYGHTMEVFDIYLSNFEKYIITIREINSEEFKKTEEAIKALGTSSSWSEKYRVKNMPHYKFIKSKNYEKFITLWKNFSSYEDITTDAIEKCINMPLDWRAISNNKNLSPLFITKYIHKPWDYSALITNNCDRYKSAIKIQRWWRKNTNLIKWKRKIEEVNEEIIFNPDSKGIIFMEAKNDFEERREQFV